jgi:hypothetical protein
MAVVLLPRPALADIGPRSPVIIVNLSDADQGFTVISAKTFNDAIGTNSALDWPLDDDVQHALQRGRDPNPAFRIQSATPLERVLGACKSQPRERLTAAAPYIERLYSCVGCLNAYRETRFFTRPGDTAVLLVLYDANQYNADQIRPVFREAPRQSELIATARALAGLFRQESGRAPAPSCESFLYTLQRSRSRFTIAVPTPPSLRGEPSDGGGSDELIDGSTPAATANGKVLTSPEMVLGPSERWFFSADFSLSLTGVKLGETPTADAEKLKNKDFFIALNLAAADLLADRDARLQRRSLLRELLIKLQVTPSRRPWEAWAFGVGLRGARARAILWNMDVVHPYFTVGRQTVDDEAQWRTVVGFGFDPRSLGGKD